ncbi:hypothetical protein C1Y41_04715 [Pantoea sp. ICBG 1758]|uniref:hypothetical protein n=1 Tax=Pantoea sp. ICBG 1758 TaxID=2071682 RepID=UPI000CE30FB5|nr:hypothetical protein [Pantoea sp. ICBG 1758]PPC63949.1 hypothetical protein C1Y41_04715 [Pantoea sp. ICBG 1758]
MQFDKLYAIQILKLFKDSEQDHLTVLDINESGINIKTSKFYHHLNHLNLDGLVELCNGDEGIGYFPAPIDDGSMGKWNILDLRMTPRGYQYLESL